MDIKQRHPERSRSEQLLTLVNNWDPANVLAEGASRHQYEAITNELFGLLSRGATRDEVSQFLNSKTTEHFGRPPHDVEQFVNRVFVWYDINPE